MISAHADPAAVLACALSLYQSCMQQSRDDVTLNLSDRYKGIDQFLREVMRVATLFENWASEQVAFEELVEVWPYFMQDQFGDACIQVLDGGALNEFDANACMRVAHKLQIPRHVDGSLP